MVTIDNKGTAALKIQSTPKPVQQEKKPQQARPAPKPVSKPKFVPKLVPKQPAAKPKQTPQSKKNIINNIVAEKFRRQKVAEFNAQQKTMERSHDKAMKRLLTEATEKLKKLAEFITDNTHLTARKFTIHEATNRVNVRIIDSVTGELIREVPGQDFLDRVSKMEKMMGSFFDTMV